MVISCGIPIAGDIGGRSSRDVWRRKSALKGRARGL